MHFYPRPHMEGDPPRPPTSPVPAISTHALTWRATSAISTSSSITKAFLPTPSHGGRPRILLGERKDGEFLPTPSHGGRQAQFILTYEKEYFYPRPHMEGDSKHAEVQACISAAYLKCSTRKAAASRRCAGLGGRVVLFHQLSRLVLGRARCEPRGEGMCDRGSHRQSGRRKGLKTHSSKMSSWLH